MNKLDPQIKQNYLKFCQMAQDASNQLIDSKKIAPNNSLVVAYPEIIKFLEGTEKHNPLY